MVDSKGGRKLLVDETYDVLHSYYIHHLYSTENI